MNDAFILRSQNAGAIGLRQHPPELSTLTGARFDTLSMSRLFKRVVISYSLVLMVFGFGCGSVDSAEAVAGAAAEESFPEPPLQRRPRMPLSWKEFPGSNELVETTTVLFENGMADPRGCEYRRIKIQIGNVGYIRGAEVETHGWMLPRAEASSPGSSNANGDASTAKDEKAQQFAVCWNGLVYPVISFGERCDLDRDVAVMFVNSGTKTKSSKASPRSRAESNYFGPAEARAVSFELLSSEKCPLLLRLGKPEAAKAI